MSSQSVSPSLRFATRAASACRSAPTRVQLPRTSLYEVLRVDHTASPTQIKAAYRTLAKTHHPDAAAQSDGLHFIQIHQAYATLSDPAARAVYDVSVAVSRRTLPFNRTGFYTTRRWETDQCW